MSQKTAPVRPVPSRVSGGVPWWLWLILIVFGLGVGVKVIQKVTPDDPALAFSEGIKAFEANKVKDLEASIQTLKRHPDLLAQQKLLEGMYMLGKSKPLLAIPLLDEATKEPKIRSRALTLLGNAYLRARQPLDSIKVFETAVEEDPKANEARLMITYVLKDMICWDEALEHLEILGKENYKADVVHQMLGEIYAETGRYAEAAEQFQNAIEADPTNPLNSRRATNYLKCCLETGDLSGVDDWRSNTDSQALAESVHAMLLLEKDDVRSALACLEGPMQEMPNDVTANLTYARVMEKFGNKERAIEALASLQGPMKFITRNRQLFEVVAKLAALAGEEKTAIAAQQNAEQLKDLESQFDAKLKEVTRTRDAVQERLALGDLAVAIGRFDFAAICYRSVSLIDSSQEGVVDQRIRDHYNVQPMLVPFANDGSEVSKEEPAKAAEPASTPEPKAAATPEPEKAKASTPDATPTEEPKTEEPKTEEPKTEEPKTEEPKTGTSES